MLNDTIIVVVVVVIEAIVMYLSRFWVGEEQSQQPSVF